MVDNGEQYVIMVVRASDCPVHEPRNFNTMKEFKDSHLVVYAKCKLLAITLTFVTET